MGGPGSVGDGEPSDNGPQAVLVGLLQNLGTAGVPFPKTVVAASLFPNVGRCWLYHGVTAHAGIAVGQQKCG